MDYYDILINGISDDVCVVSVTNGRTWTAAELSDGRYGIALHNTGRSFARSFDTLVGLPASKAAEAVRSWNLEEASEGMAVINAFYNCEHNLRRLSAQCEYDTSCTEGMDTHGKKIALIGHLSLQPKALEGAEKVYIIERDPKPGDYPDPACEYLLPECDIVIITASAAINKTMPRILKLAENAKTVIIGPSAPLCPELLSGGVSRISGMIVRDKAEFKAWVSDGCGNPYPFGSVFMI